MILVARLRGWLIPLMFGLCIAAISFIWGQTPAVLPLADGPRQVAHYVGAFTPSVIGTCLIDRFPEISRSLPLEGKAQRLALGLYWFMWLVALGPILASPFIGTLPGRYWLTAVLLLSVLTTITSTRFGVNGLLGALLISTIWVVAGDTFAPFLGFDLEQHSPTPGATPITLAIAIVIAIGATLTLCFTAGRAHR